MTCPICGTALGPPAFGSPDRLHGTASRHAVALCRRCGAGVTLPRVGDDELAAFYPEDYGPYDERMNALERVASRAIRAFQGWNGLRSEPLHALRGRPPGRGLDVGCGRGDLASTLAGRGWTMAGIEPSPAACAAARSRGIDARCGTLSTVSVEPGAYDAVVFRHSLEHTNDPVTALRYVAAALRPGGQVLITVPNFGGWQARRFHGYWYHLDLPRHRVNFTSSALRRAVKAAGLQVVSLSTSSTPVGLPASMQYRLFGRCLFPSGLALRVALALCALSLPVTALLDLVLDEGDLLHAVATLPA